MIVGFDLLAFGIVAVVVTALLFEVTRLRIKRKKLANEVIQLTLEKMSLLYMLEKAATEQESKDIEKTDGFLKFVSDSRDWAFDYIEQVQAALGTFTKAAGPDIKYIVKYGLLIEHPLQESIKRISEAYIELEKLLPEETKQV